MWKLIFKAIGALLILYTGGALGWRRGDACARRVRVLEELCDFLAAARRELHFRCGRTEEILAEAQKNTCRTALPLYFAGLGTGGGLQTRLEQALCRTEREIADVTQPAERALLRGALESLGGCPAREEEQRLAHAQSVLERALEQARAQAATQRRLYRAIGFSLGGAAALLLL